MKNVRVSWYDSTTISQGVHHELPAFGGTTQHFQNSFCSKMIDTGCESPGTTLMHILIVKFNSEAFTSLQSGSSHSWLITLPWRRAPWCLCCLWCHQICGSDKVEVSVQCCQYCGVNNDIKSRLNFWHDVVHGSHGSLCPFPESSKSPEDIFLPSLA